MDIVYKGSKINNKHMQIKRIYKDGRLVKVYKNGKLIIK